MHVLLFLNFSLFIPQLFPNKVQKMENSLERSALHWKPKGIYITESDFGKTIEKQRVERATELPISVFSEALTNPRIFRSQKASVSWEINNRLHFRRDSNAVIDRAAFMALRCSSASSHHRHCLCAAVSLVRCGVQLWGRFVANKSRRKRSYLCRCGRESRSFRCWDCPVSSVLWCTVQFLKGLSCDTFLRSVRSASGCFKLGMTMQWPLLA